MGVKRPTGSLLRRIRQVLYRPRRIAPGVASAGDASPYPWLIISPSWGKGTQGARELLQGFTGTHGRGAVDHDPLDALAQMDWAR